LTFDFIADPRVDDSDNDEAQKDENVADIPASTEHRLMTMFATSMHKQEGPGEYHSEGPRHSNDHANYRRISILPTPDEVLSTKLPYLPTIHEIQPIRGNNSIDNYLDAQFRLLREDMLAPFRRAVQCVLDNNILSKLKGFFDL